MLSGKHVHLVGVLLVHGIDAVRHLRYHVERPRMSPIGVIGRFQKLLRWGFGQVRNKINV
jgi:hypothetical protein